MTRVTLESAGAEQAELFGNLLELYIHDLSAQFPHVELGPDGRFGYPALASYLSGASDRFAFLIRCDDRVAGFVLARRGSPLSDDPNVLDVAEFFVLRQFRTRGVGRAAAKLLWERVPGNWTIRAAQSNPDAVRFWRSAVAAIAGERARESERRVGSANWVVFSIDAT